jgi:hypothetical protein
MRRFIALSIIVAALACSGEATNPAGPVINVRVIDDIGKPVDRTEIHAVMSDLRHEASTNRDGTARIRVADPGIYEIRVIPRDGYIAGVEPLTKTVTVESTSTAAVEFTVHRGSGSTEEFYPLYPGY